MNNIKRNRIKYGEKFSLHSTLDAKLSIKTHKFEIRVKKILYCI